MRVDHLVCLVERFVYHDVAPLGSGFLSVIWLGARMKSLEGGQRGEEAFGNEEV